MAQRTGAAGTGRAVAALHGVAVVLLLTSCPLLRSAVVWRWGDPGLAGFLVPALVGAVLAALLLCLRSDGFQSLWGRRRAPFLACAAVAYAVTGLAFYLLSRPAFPLPVSGALGLLSGVSSTLLLCAAAWPLLGVPLGRSMVCVALMFGASTCLTWVASGLLPAVAYHVPCGLATVVAGALTVVAGMRGPSSGSVPAVSGENGPKAGFGVSCRRLSAVAGVALIGLFSYAFFIKPGIGEGAVRPRLYGMDEELGLHLVACLLLLFIGLARRRQPVLSTVNQLVVPVVAAVLLVLQSFPLEGGALSLWAALAVFSTSFASLFAVAVVLSFAGNGEVPPPFAIGAALLTYALGRLTGMLFGTLTYADDGRYTLYRVAMTAILAAMLLAVVFSLRRSHAGDVPAVGATVEDALVGASDRLAAERQLTAREAQVLRFLVRGWTSTSIASELVISENTVRTHMKNIYRKIGVSSRAELTALVGSYGRDG